MRAKTILPLIMSALFFVGLISCTTENNGDGENGVDQQDSMSEVDSLVEGLEILQKHM